MEKPNTCMLVIFGATGDLNKRKIIPALYNLFLKGSLKYDMPILNIGRRDLTKKQFLKLLDLKGHIPNADKKKLSGFIELLHYARLDLDSIKFDDFRTNIENIEKKHKCGKNKVFYLATPPELFRKVTYVIKSSGVLQGEGYKRVVFEKPFGHDLRSAQNLNKDILTIFKEKDIFRIDHYLGKELVQNIMVFRFANIIFEQIWNKDFIDNVQITVSEQIGVEERASYYDKSGALKDMIQNHLLQVLSLVAMEAPKKIDADHIRDEKVKVFNSLRKIRPKDIVIGQYGSGKIGGKKVVGYRNEKNINNGSLTETFVALKAEINNKRWKGVPFYLRTGKRMSKKFAEINIVLKEESCELFHLQTCNLPNIITIRIQPDEGIIIWFNAKVPGAEIKIGPGKMEFCHKCLFGMNTPEAYELLLHEIMRGDQTLFTRWDGVESSWKYVDPIIKMIKNNKIKLYLYDSGSLGPKESESLLKRDGKSWIEYKGG